jgi:hypothetical protein
LRYPATTGLPTEYDNLRMNLNDFN